MTYVVFIKYAVIVLAVIVLVRVVHSNGRSVERGECMAEKNQQLQKAQEDLKASVARNAKLASENERLNSEVTANAEKQMQQVAAADAAMRRDPAGLRIPTQTCRQANVQLPSTAGGTEGDNTGGRPEGIRLPAGIEADLYDYAARANRTRIKRDECQDFAIGLAKMREEWERQQNESDP
jgi:hypothetical protein